MQLVKSDLSQEEIHNELLALTKYPRFYEFDHFTYADNKGVYQTSDLTAPGGKNKYDIIHCHTPMGGVIADRFQTAEETKF